MELLLTVLLFAAAVGAGIAAALARQRGGKLRRTSAERDALANELAERRNQERDANTLRIRLDERDREFERLRTEREEEIEAFRDETQELAEVRESVGTLLRMVKANGDGANGREGGPLSLTQHIAGSHGRGAFGEEALRNQLAMIGLVEGRDYERQIHEVGGRRRIDYAVYLRGSTIGIDPKLALDPDLDSISKALAEGDEDQLQGYAKRLVERAEELAKKEYWEHLQRSPSFVLMYVPIEGIQEVLVALPKFSYEKFAIEHGVYIVTPLQLVTTLGVIADVAHAAKRSQETEEVERELIALDREMARFVEHYARHGRELAAVLSTYNSGVGMLSSRGGLGRMVRKVRGYSRRLVSRPEEPSFPPVRDDVEAIAAEHWEAAEAADSAVLRTSA